MANRRHIFHNPMFLKVSLAIDHNFYSGSLLMPMCLQYQV